jgi:hypothetical protein
MRLKLLGLYWQLFDFEQLVSPRISVPGCSMAGKRLKIAKTYLNDARRTVITECI